MRDKRTRKNVARWGQHLTTETRDFCSVFDIGSGSFRLTLVEDGNGAGQ